MVLEALARRAQELHRVEQQNLATMVVNTLAKAVKRGS